MPCIWATPGSFPASCRATVDGLGSGEEMQHIRHRIPGADMSVIYHLE